MIRAVLFDLDATLVDDDLNWRRSVTQVLERICERHGDVDLQDLLTTYYQVAGEIWDTIKDAPVSPWGNMDEEQIVQRVWGETLHRFHLSDESTLQEAADAYLRFRSVGAEPYDDVESCLNGFLHVMSLASSPMDWPQCNSRRSSPRDWPNTSR